MTGTARAILGVASFILVGFFIGALLISVVFVFAISPYWWIGVFGAATGIVLSTIGALIAIGGASK